MYRTDAITYAVARRLVRVPYVGLPNLVLGRRAFPELIQTEASAAAVARELARVLRDPAPFDAACADVRERLAAGLGSVPPAERVADLLHPWLGS